MIKDAAGNRPKPMTAFEIKWKDAVQSGELQKRFDELQARTELPLKEKIRLSEERIREWYEAWGGQVAVSYSGGKDSSVLLWLVRRLYPDVQAVFCHTGLEYPELLSMVKATPNTVIIRPKMPFFKVINKYGYPMVSKKVARGVNILRHPTDRNQNIYRLYDEGINRFGRPVSGFKVAKRWRFLIDAPFELSDKCCSIMKKEPMQRYTRETGNCQFVGIMAADSKQRQRAYLQSGCNAFDAKQPKSTPMGFWTQQDILQCLKMYSIPYASVYGDIMQAPDTGALYFTGVKSTGCVFCGFGLHMEESPNRFQLLYDSHPKLWNYCMGKLNLREILEYMQTNCPDRHVRMKFKAEPAPPALKQTSLFN